MPKQMSKETLKKAKARNARRRADKEKRGQVADKRRKGLLGKFSVKNAEKHAVVDPLFERENSPIFMDLLQALHKEGYSFSFARATSKTKGGKYKDYLSRDVMDAENTANADLLVAWGIPTRWKLETELKKNVLSFVHGFFSGFWICDSKGFWGDSMVVNTIGEEIEKCMDDDRISWSVEHSNAMVKNNKSKRRQSSNNIEIKDDFVFLPTQDISDASIRMYGGMSYLEFINQVVDFCKESGLGLVAKRHPVLNKKPGKVRTWRVGQNAKINEVFKRAKKMLGKKFVEVEGSIHYYCSNCLCMVGLNTAAVVDAFMNDCVVSHHAQSMFMNSGAVVHDYDIGRGLNTAINMNQGSKEVLYKRQKALLYYLYHKYLVSTTTDKLEFSNEDKIRNALKHLEQI